jgi:CrcB protein
MRFLVSNYTQRFWNLNSFPLGTFVVNVIGCFLIGMLSAYFLKVDNLLKFFLITGFCGGFTTFSTFSTENFSSWQSGNYITLALYITLSVLLGFFAVFMGFQVMEK